MAGLVPAISFERAQHRQSDRDHSRSRLLPTSVAFLLASRVQPARGLGRASCSRSARRARRPGDDNGGVMAGRLSSGLTRGCPGHPRLRASRICKAWMPGTRPGMTSVLSWVPAFAGTNGFDSGRSPTLVARKTRGLNGVGHRFVALVDVVKIRDLAVATRPRREVRDIDG
jgi:hypothetical protein